MSCDCAALRTEILSQRKLMVEWFESLMTELQDVKSQLITKFNGFNTGEEQSPTAQQLSANHVVTEPFSASVFLEKNHNNLLFGEAALNKNEIHMSIEPTQNQDLPTNAEPAIGVSQELLAPKLELADTEEFSVEFESPPVDSRSLLQSEQSTSAIGKSVGSLDSMPKQQFMMDEDGNRTQNLPEKSHQSNKRGKIFRCTRCPYQALEASSMRKHLMAHSRFKPFACDLCPVKCRSMAEMRVHKRCHTGEKPFSCRYCPYRCIKNSDIVRHERCHTGEKPFACDQCDYRACQKSALMGHLATHTGEKPFQCDLCEYRAASRPHINKHKKRCHSKKP